MYVCGVSIPQMCLRDVLVPTVGAQNVKLVNPSEWTKYWTKKNIFCANY